VPRPLDGRFGDREPGRSKFQDRAGVGKAYSTSEQLGLLGDRGELWESLRLVGEEKRICASGGKIYNHIDLG